MIKSSVKKLKSMSKSGAYVTTKNSGEKTGFYGKHNKQTISPAREKATLFVPCYGRKSGREQIKTTGGY